MKKNQSGKYEQIEGEVTIKDIETGEKILFLLDPDTELVIRSLLEEDIKEATNLLRVSPGERRKKKRELWEMVPTKGSENYVFVVERIVGNNSENPYEKDREMIGYGFRKDQEIFMGIFKREEEAPNIKKMVEELGRYYGVHGVPYSISRK